ncbi:MAG: D-alanyl-D-alanine carboxypeptidase [Clostridia bacterium]|nr:D-alanyl-D-alanine carboxypeptidase [Clostridia bacterium]
MNNKEFDKRKLFYIIVMAILAVVLLVLVVIAGFTSGRHIDSMSEPDVSAVSKDGSVPEQESGSDISDVSQDESGAGEISDISQEPVESQVSEPLSEPVSEESSQISAEESREESKEESSEASEEPSVPDFDPYNIKTSGVSANGKTFPKNAADNTTAGFVAIYNVTKGEFIYTKNATDKAYPASMTKLITAMLAEKYLDKSEDIVVGKEIELVKAHSSLAYLYNGEKLPLETVMDAMLLPSGNDAAYVLGVNVGRKILGSSKAPLQACLDAFCEEANRFVQSIGCKHTHITCPDGYHDDAHYSTAGDFALISAEVVKNYPLVKKVCAKKHAKDGYKLEWDNTNNMLDYSYVNGLKTGCTNEAGYCISLSAHAENNDIVIIIMNCSNTSTRTSDAKTLLSCAFGWY